MIKYAITCTDGRVDTYKTDIVEEDEIDGEVDEVDGDEVSSTDDLFTNMKTYKVGKVKESFKTVCKRLNLDESLWKIYYNWVNDNFRRGHSHCRVD
jgi:hypothetical protein